jgi:hypothetical protein
VAIAHQAALGGPLTAAEQEQLTSLLRRLAGGHGLTEQNLPSGQPRRR